MKLDSQQSPEPDISRQATRIDLRLIFIYAACAALWILFSDRAMLWLFRDPAQIAVASILKGWLFVSVTSGLLYVMLKGWRESLGAGGLGAAPDGAAPRPATLILIFIALALVVPLIGLAFVQLQTPQLENEAYRKLQAVARLKGEQIENWLTERRGDADELMNTKGLMGQVDKVVRGGSISQDSLDVEQRFRSLIVNYRYDSILLFDKRGTLLLSQGNHLDTPPAVLDRIVRSISSMQVQRGDLFRDGTGNVHLDWVVPVVVADEQGQRAVAAIVLRVVAAKFLFPLIQTWPAEDASAETLLLRRDGDSVLFLNDLRHRPNTALRLRLPLNTPDLVSGISLRPAQRGTARGVDYRGVSVLTAFRPVAGTDWHLVAKVDRDAVLAPMWQMLAWLGLIAFAAVAAIILALLLLWRQQTRSQKLQLLAQRTESERLLGTLADNSTDAIFIKDLAGRYLLTNRESDRVTGKTVGQAVGCDDFELFPEQATTIRANDRAVIDEDQIVTFEETVSTARGTRTFMTTKGPLREDNGRILGIFGVSHDITDRQAADAALRDSEQRLKLALQAANQGLYDLNVQTGQAVVSAEYASMLGYDPADFDETNAAWLERLHPDDQARVGRVYQDYIEGLTPEYRVEFRQKTRNGAWKWILSLGRLVSRDADGRPLRMLGTHTDITARKEAEYKVSRLAQLYAALSQCNQTIVRCTNEADLFPQICRDVVRIGGMKMAWIGLLDETDQRVRPVASHGDDDGYLTVLQVSVAVDDPVGQGPTGAAFCKDQPVWCQDFAQDPLTAPWHEPGGRAGWASSAALPLHRKGKVIGCLSVYAAEINAFDEGVRSLLMEMARDISFALDNFARDAALRESEALYRSILEASPDDIIITDLEGRIQMVSPAGLKLMGHDSVDEGLGRSLTDFLVPEDSERAEARVTALLQGVSAGPGAYRAQRRDGSTIDLEVNGAIIRDAAALPSRLLFICRDISERKRAEVALRQGRDMILRLSSQVPGAVYQYRLYPDGRSCFPFSSPGINDIYEVTPEAVKEDAAVVFTLIHPDDLERVNAEVQDSAHTLKTLHTEFRVVLPRQGLRWRMCDATPERMQDGGTLWHGIITDITERRENEARINLEVERTAALLSMSESAESMDEKAIMQFGLGLAERITGSQIGFIHFVNEDQESIELVAWSQGTLEHYCTAAFDSHYPVSEAGIWADALRQRAPLLVNDYATASGKRGLPAGHAHLARLISVPVMAGGKVRMMVGVGNKPAPYEAFDLETVRLVADTIWHIVHQRRVDAALRESEQRHRLLADNAGDVIWTMDLQGCLTYISPSVEKLRGYTSEEAMQQSLEQMLCPSSLRVASEILARNLAAFNAGLAMTDFRGEFEQTCKNGGTVWTEISSSPLKDAEGHVIGILGVTRDISERMASDQKLRKLSLAVEQSPESIVITNVRAEIEYVNEAFLHATGYSREEVIGKNPRVVQSGKTPPETYIAMWAELSQGRAWKGEFFNRRKDGSEYTEFAIITPLRQADGTITHYVAVKEDVTERERNAAELDEHRRHLEELVARRTVELTLARQQAETANQAKSAFLANMSHEIRTPMNAIIGLTHLLRIGGVTPEQGSRLSLIDRSGRHLLSIINDILDLSKIEAGHLQIESVDFRLTNLLDSVASIMMPQAKARGLRLDFKCGDVPEWLRGDPTRLRQAMLNYVGNAIKFTDSGVVSARVALLEDRGAELLLYFEVSDTGIGIDADKLGQLFQAFAQADVTTTRHYGGTGLGLSITKRLAMLMGGDVGVKSTVGEGSTFWFTVRLQRGQGIMPAANRADSGDAAAKLRQHHSGARILLAEDSDINREVAIELLKVAGLSVDTAADGVEAVEKARGSLYDLVLMDMQMPNLDGLSATRVIRALPGWGDRPIVALTANAFVEDRRACEAAGMNDFMAKPMDPDLLYRIVLKWLSGRAADGEAAASCEALETSGPKQAEAIALQSDTAALLSRLGGVTALDLDRGLALLPGNPGKYLSLLRRFVTTHAHDMTRLGSSMSAGDAPAALRLAHTLKGTAAMLAVDSVAQAAGELESMLLGDGDTPPDRDALQPDMLQISQAFAALTAAFESTAAASQPAQVAEPPVLDLQAGLAFFAGNLTAYHRMLLRFTSMHGGDAELLRAALDAGDPTTAQRLAHTLKGTSATLGMEPLRAVAASLERKIRDAAPAPELVDGGAVLGQALAAAVKAIEAEHLEVEEPPEQAVNWPRLKAGIKRLEAQLATDDFGAGETWLEIRSALTQAAGADAVAALGPKIEGFDFPGALVDLRQIVKRHPALSVEP